VLLLLIVKSYSILLTIRCVL